LGTACPMLSRDNVPTSGMNFVIGTDPLLRGTRWIVAERKEKKRTSGR
jgi:hypothetical protein